MSNKTIGKFEILETLGQGGYGTVYRVMDTTLKVERALKILHPKYQLDPSFTERFHQVAQIAARLEHAHIVPIYEMNQIGEHVFICMKYLAGGSLKERIEKNEKLNFEEAVEITRQIAEGLDYAYKMPEHLVHNDINPNNILFEKDGAVRLSDFGFMKALSEVDSLSMNLSGGIVGNPAYTAPEIWDKKESASTSDVYSLACVFFEMITGDVLFDGRMSEVIKKHLIDGAQLPDQWGQDIPAEINTVLEKALARDPEERIQSVDEFIQELEKLPKPKSKKGGEKPRKEVITIGKYEILETLGQGGYGTVYRVRDSILNVERALKVLHSVLMSDPTFIERFRNEAQITARLDHPNIVPVYEMDQIGEHIYIAMKYMEGGSLSDVIAKKKTLPFQEALEITRQIAAALEYGYTQADNLVHRDIKPANILFEKDGRARLSDFGFAKLLAEGDSLSLSRSGGIVGTPAYIAPEIWDGKQASPATDVYSLACTFYEMITGEILFDGNTSQVIKKHVIDGPKFPERWKQGVPEGIGEVLEKALAREANQRYALSIEFLEELESLTKKEKPKAPPVIKIPEKKVDKHGIPMVLIPAGSFMMGSNDGRQDEKPVHEVWLDDYYMDIYPVTNESYEKFLNDRSNQIEGDLLWFDEDSEDTKIKQRGGVWKVVQGYKDHPVVNVTWYGAQAYCIWRGGRLPTEAEWEKSARGRLEDKKYPWGNEKPSCEKMAKNGAQYRSCNGKTVAIGSFAANGYGLYDMAGNVWEWVADWYDSGFYRKSESKNPTGTNSGIYRVLRGGSWYGYPYELRVANRYGNNPGFASYVYGFRCAGSP
jgi:eukaryotic-like serine/threonine-protein kinase